MTELDHIKLASMIMVELMVDTIILCMGVEYKVIVGQLILTFQEVASSHWYHQLFRSAKWAMEKYKMFRVLYSLKGSEYQWHRLSLE